MTLADESLSEVEALADEIEGLQRQRNTDLAAWSKLRATTQGQTANAGQRLFDRMARAGWLIRKAERRIAELLDAAVVTA